jgi:hypothetical protein
MAAVVEIAPAVVEAAVAVVVDAVSSKCPTTPT